MAHIRAVVQYALACCCCCCCCYFYSVFINGQLIFIRKKLLWITNIVDISLKPCHIHDTTFKWYQEATHTVLQNTYYDRIIWWAAEWFFFFIFLTVAKSQAIRSDNSFGWNDLLQLFSDKIQSKRYSMVMKWVLTAYRQCYWTWSFSVRSFLFHSYPLSIRLLFYAFHSFSTKLSKRDDFENEN